MKMAIRTGIPVLVGVVALACGEAEPPATPALEAVTLAGDSVALADLRGEVLLVNVWATWCVPCRQEAPELQALHEARGDSLRVIGVTVDNRGAEEQIRTFIDQHGMTYEIWWDPDGSAIEVFGAAGVPLTVLLDREGQIVWRHLGTFRADDPALLDALRSTT